MTASVNLVGIPASSGTARGVARVARSPADLDPRGPTGILVVDTAEARWTPYFASIDALVAEVGGALSASLTVARENGLPAVVGVRAATRVIRDGDLLEVDGSRGVVRIIVTG